MADDGGQMKDGGWAERGKMNDGGRYREDPRTGGLEAE
jgi:hypothetical protein